MNPIVILVLYFLTLCAIVGAFIIYKYRINAKSEENAQGNAQVNRAPVGGGGGGGRGRGLDQLRNRLRQRVRGGGGGGGDNDDDVGAMVDERNNGDGDKQNDVDTSNMTKAERKAFMKKQRKEQRAAERNFEREQLDAKNRKQADRDAARRAKQEERERLEAEAEAEAAKLAEEKRKAEEEEYAKWKDAFAVDEAGSVTAMTEEESQSLLQEFIDYLKDHKYVELDTLGGVFNMRTQDVVDRIKTLESSGRITGVIDDRGKFIYIEPHELDALASFVNRRGRITISDMVSEANKVIDLS